MKDTKTDNKKKSNIPPFKDYQAKVTNYQVLADKIVLVSFHTQERIKFVAGQYFSFKIDEKTNRPYSVCSSPENFNNFNNIEFLVDLMPGGAGSKFFQTLVVEEKVSIKGPFGFFTLDKILGQKLPNEDDHIIFVATGTGIAPHRSMIYDLIKTKKYSGKISLYFGLRYNDQTYFFEEFQKLSEMHQNFSFIPVISKPDRNWKGETGHCQDAILKNKSIKNAKFLICGATKNVNSISDDLINAGFKKENIFYEKYG